MDDKTMTELLKKRLQRTNPHQRGILLDGYAFVKYEVPAFDFWLLAQVPSHQGTSQPVRLLSPSDSRSPHSYAVRGGWQLHLVFCFWPLCRLYVVYLLVRMYVCTQNFSEDVLIRKCEARRVCSSCGEGYNVANIMDEGLTMPAILPKVEGKCDHCCGTLVQRADDKLVG